MSTDSTRVNHDAFPALDGMRALAVAMVVGTHAAFWTGSYVNSAFKAPLARLDSGVAIFFVLSGFLLVRPWLLAARDGQTRPSNRVYLWRRALRILPLYWITVALALPLVEQNPPVTGADWWHHAFLLQTLHFGWLRGGLTQTWSLCTEVGFYLVLPFFGWAIHRWSRRFGWHPAHLLFGCLALSCISVIWPFAIYHTAFGLDWTANLWLPAYLSWFAGGMALAVLQVHTSGARLSSAWQRRWDLARSMPGVFLAASLALFAISFTPIAGPLGLSTAAENVTAAARSTLYAFAAVLLVFPAIFSPQSRFTALLSSRPMRRLGEWSYGVFLLHVILLEGVMHLFGWPLFTGNTLYVFVTTFIVSTAVAALTYRYIELPVMRWRRLVTGRSGRSGPSQTAPDPAPRQPAEAR